MHDDGWKKTMMDRKHNEGSKCSDRPHLKHKNSYIYPKHIPRHIPKSGHGIYKKNSSIFADKPSLFSFLPSTTGICENHCIILYVYIGVAGDTGGVLTFYIPARLSGVDV